MSRLAPTVQFLAVVAILVTHPIGAWYCLSEGGLCATAICQTDDGDTGNSCCDAQPTVPGEDTCCVELLSDWQVLPGSLGAVPPQPASFELLLADSVSSVASPAPGTVDELMTRQDEFLPRPSVPPRALLCRFLI